MSPSMVMVLLPLFLTASGTLLVTTSVSTHAFFFQSAIRPEEESTSFFHLWPYEMLRNRPDIQVSGRRGKKATEATEATMAVANGK